MLTSWSGITDGRRRLGHSWIVNDESMSRKKVLEIANSIGEPEMAWMPPVEEFTSDHWKVIPQFFHLGRQVADDPSAADPAVEASPEIAETLAACGEPLVGGDSATAEKTKRSRAEQSRINGAKSRGPKTIDGKMATRMNAFRHGLRSRLGMLPDEYIDEYRAYIATVVAELTPTTLLQRELARRVAELSWRLRRMPLVEKHLVDGDMPKSMDDVDPEVINARLCDQIVGIDAELPKLQRYATTLERSIRSCLRELRQLQGATAGVGAEMAIGVGTIRDMNASTTVAIDASEKPVVVSAPPAVPKPAAVATPAAIPVTAPPRPPAASRPAAPATVAPTPAAPPMPVGGSTPTDGMRFSGSFGATLMPMATVPLVANQAAVAISGSFGKPPRPASGTRPPTISNDIAPFGMGA